jgi:hypothetical protein
MLRKKPMSGNHTPHHDDFTTLRWCTEFTLKHRTKNEYVRCIAVNGMPSLYKCTVESNSRIVHQGLLLVQDRNTATVTPKESKNEQILIDINNYEAIMLLCQLS